MYEVKLDDIIFPLAPSNIHTTFDVKNTEFGLMNGETISVQNKYGVEKITMTLLLPQTNYVKAYYADGFKKPSHYIKKLNQIRKDRRAVKLIVSRKDDRDKKYYNTSRTVTIETYSIFEKADEGTDVTIELVLKVYKEFKSKIGNKTPSRSLENKPKIDSHTVVKGDTLWLLAQKYLKSGGRYHEIYLLNKETIDNANNGTGNPTYTIYPGQIISIPD